MTEKQAVIMRRLDDFLSDPQSEKNRNVAELIKARLLATPEGRAALTVVQNPKKGC